jgi:hypothetical protein
VWQHPCRIFVEDEFQWHARCITEMGVDVHGKDATKAARRAVSDAIRHSSLSFVRLFGKTPQDVFVDVTISVPNRHGGGGDGAALRAKMRRVGKF